MRILFWSLIVCCCLPLSAQVYQPSSDAVTVDGDDSEWTQGEYLYDQDSKMSYAFRKSDSHLFLILRTNQRETLIQSRISGIEIWVNSNGKKKRKVGVQYPMGRSGRQGQGQRPDQANSEPRTGQGQQGRRPGRGGGMRRMPTKIKLVGLYGDEGEPIVAELNTLDKPIDVKAQMHEDGFWVYELALPLDAFPAGKKSSDVWRIGIENPEFEMPDPSEFRNRQGGGGMRPGGGMTP
ncbi:MAG: hypothetical protein AAFV07_15205, partial [Bacteroidota bacterium]